MSRIRPLWGNEHMTWHIFLWQGYEEIHITTVIVRSYESCPRDTLINISNLFTRAPCFTFGFHTTLCNQTQKAGLPPQIDADIFIPLRKENNFIDIVYHSLNSKKIQLRNCSHTMPGLSYAVWVKWVPLLNSSVSALTRLAGVCWVQVVESPHWKIWGNQSALGISVNPAKIWASAAC